MRSANKAPTDHSIIGWGKYIMEDWVARTGRSGYFQACANIDERLKISIEAEKKIFYNSISHVLMGHTPPNTLVGYVFFNKKSKI